MYRNSDRPTETAKIRSCYMSYRIPLILIILPQSSTSCRLTKCDPNSRYPFRIILPSHSRFATNQSGRIRVKRLQSPQSTVEWDVGVFSGQTEKSKPKVEVAQIKFRFPKCLFETVIQLNLYHEKILRETLGFLKMGSSIL